MKYDFETVFSRKGTGSSKWEEMYKLVPETPNDMVPFSVADMEFATPPAIVERIQNYVSDNILGYTRKTQEYLDAVCSWMKERHGWEIAGDWIVDYPAIVPAVFALVRLLTKPGDGVILMTPSYFPFYNAVRQAEGRMLVENELLYQEGKYLIDFADFEEKAKDPANKLLILCNPHNPVGRVWTREELDRIGRICLDNGVFIITDDIHCDLVMDGYEHTFLPTLSEEYAQNCVVCTAPSKTFNLAGLITSNLIIPNLDVRKAILHQKKNAGINYCNVLGYQSCIAAYTECGEWLDELMVVLNHNRLLLKEYIEKNIPEIRVIDLEGTYLQWLDCRGVGIGHEELEKLMHEYYLFLDEGYVFGACGEGFERINIACPTTVLQAALERLKAAVESVRK